MMICGRSGRRSRNCDLKTVKSILSVAGLRIERNGTVILADVNWQVNAGEHWVILGATGASCGRKSASLARPSGK